MASNARNLSKLLGTSTQVPTTALPTAIADLETIGTSLSGGDIAPKNISSNTLTQSFDSNQTVNFNMSDSIDTISPIVSVFKEIPQTGVISKGNWDVNANATNYDFFDEKPISYSSITLTPSATGDGTFTSSNPTETSYDFSNPTTGATSTFTVPTANGGQTSRVLAFSTDGAKVLSWDNADNKLKSYDLSTAWDITTISSSASAQSSISTGALYTSHISADGTKFITWNNADAVTREYSMSTPFDVTTLSSVGSATLLSYANLFNWFIKPGTYDTFYVVVNRHLYKYTFTGGSITTGTITQSGNDLDLDPSNQKSYSNNGQIQFKPDGTEFYIGQATDSIIEKWTLSTAWDITTATKSSESVTNVNVGTIWLKPNGEKIYYIDPSDRKIKEIVIGSTLAFNAADVGKKVVGNSGSAIITATSGTYKSVTPFADTSAISSWQLFGAQGKSDGSGIQLSGYGNTYDLSNLSYDSKSYNASSDLPNAQGIAFKSDGTKMYLNAFNTASDQNTNQQIKQYSLSTAYDISTATYDNTYLNVSGQNTRQRDLRFKPDGTILYMIGSTPDGIWQYTLSTAWDLSTATYSNKTINVGGQDTNPAALVLSPDGTKVYVGGYSSKTLYQYNLSTAWDLSTSSYSNNSFATTNDFNNAHSSLELNSSGSKIFIGAGYEIAEYNMPSDGDVSNVSYVATYDVRNTTVGNKNIGGMAFANNGAKFYIFGNNDMHAYQFSAGESVYPYSQYSPALTNSSNGQINSSSWLDINSMTADETKNDGDIFYAVSTDNRTSWSVAKGSDGVRKIVKNNSGTWQYNNDAGSTVSVSSVADAEYINQISITIANNKLRDIIFNSDGTKMYLLLFNPNVRQFSLSVPYDISTAVNDNVTLTTSNEETLQTGMKWNNDGTKLYIVGYSNDKVHEYMLTTAYDLSTASYNNVSFSVSSQMTTPFGLTFKPDGTKMYVTDNSGNIYQYALSPAWDLSSASYDNISFSVGVRSEGIIFNSLGTKLYYTNSNILYRWTLSTAWDLSTLASESSLDFNSILPDVTSSASGLAFNGDESKIYITWRAYDGVAAYSMSITEFGTSETWVNGTTNNEHATLQEALGAQSFNRMNKAQLDAIADGYHFSQDSADTLDLMIAPYAASGTSPISDGVTINYDAEALVREAVAGTDYVAEFPSPTRLDIKSLINGNLKIRAQ